MSSQKQKLKILITGGAGFIGSAVARSVIANTHHEILVFDKLTYAGNLASLAPIATDPRYRFKLGDICDNRTVEQTLSDFAPDAVVHLAAETHVDRSIDGPADFLNTNVVGTYVLLESALRYWRRARNGDSQFRFLHVSTDEVFGSLGSEGYFNETTRYDPKSPYSATKAASDHLVRAWGHTFGLPVIVTNCSNNYGPYQFPEKLIPLTIIKGLKGAPIPVYGQGLNVRDWLFVDDHAAALISVLQDGRISETYNIGGNAERRNIDVVTAICDAMERLRPANNDRPYRELITFVDDRPGHDFRYAIDCEKMKTALDWSQQYSFEAAIENTVRWYLENRSWWEPLLEAHQADARRGTGRLGN